ncbi:unnamed protein product [Trichobilharzia regenti]|nr:unnamed protein product [Trichobilharzia regenti]
MKILIQVLFCLSILFSIFPNSNSKSQLPYPIKHNLFQSTFKINETITYYNHRLIIGHIVTIPCEYEGVKKYPNSTDSNELVIYQWLFNGRQLLPHRAFFNADWDIHGYLTIWAMMAKPANIWCHKRVINHYNIAYDYYYSHQINFINLAVLQQIVGVKIDVLMNEEAMSRKCKQDNYTCDCQMMTGINATVYGEDIDRPKHYILQSFEEFLGHLCENVTFCTNYYVEDFLCMNTLNDSTSTHYIEFAFILDNTRKYLRSTEGVKLLDEVS